MSEEEQGEVLEQESQEAPESQEQAAEGEVPAEGSETEQKSEPTDEEKTAAEDLKKAPTPEEKDPVQKRIDKLTWEKHETERKLDLFKRLGPEAYFKAYPEEKPQEPEKPQPKPVQRVADIGSMTVKHAGSQYDGMTLRDVYTLDPVYATNLQTEYLLQLKEQEGQQAAEEAERVKAVDTQFDTFTETLSKEFYGKSLKDLTEEEGQRVATEVSKAVDFMGKTKRGGGILADAYWLMTKEAKLNETATKTAKNVVESLRKTPAGHIGGGPSSTVADNFEAMTEAQLAVKVGDMSDEKKEEFYKKASPALRRKFPQWPWD